MQYMTFELEDGTLIYVETDVNDEYTRDVGPVIRGDLTEKVVHSFEESLDTIRKMSETLITKIRRGFQAQQPSEVEISFGLKASGNHRGSRSYRLMARPATSAAHRSHPAGGSRLLQSSRTG